MAKEHSALEEEEEEVKVLAVRSLAPFPKKQAFHRQTKQRVARKEQPYQNAMEVNPENSRDYTIHALSRTNKDHALRHLDHGNTTAEEEKRKKK